MSATETAAELLGGLARRDEPIGPRTTYRVGGRAELFVEVADEDGLVVVCDAVAASGIEVLVLGQGSNTLIADAGFPGLCVTLGAAFSAITVDDDRSGVQAGGGASYPILARRCAVAGATGLEWAVGIPGSVGGAVRMNAGGHGSDTATSLTCAQVVDLESGQRRELVVDELGFGYRRSAIGAHDLVVSARFALAPGEAGDAGAAIEEIVRWRRTHQPGGRNAGSVFTNPPGDSAGRLVEAAGLKGLRVGSAEVSDKHANFIQADDGGSADDVRALMEHVRRVVAERTGVVLHPEVHLVGFR